MTMLPSAACTSVRRGAKRADRLAEPIATWRRLDATTGATRQRNASVARIGLQAPLRLAVTARHLTTWSAWNRSRELLTRLTDALTGRGNPLPASHAPDSPPRSQSPSHPSAWHPRLGLFGCDVRRPADLERMAERCVRICTTHLETLLREPPSLRTLELLDEISNTACSVTSLAEACKHVHPRADWRADGAAAWSLVAPFLDSLSSHTGLHAHLRALVASPSFESLSPEARRVATTVLEDMESLGTGALASPAEGAEEECVRDEIARLLLELRTQTDAYMGALLGASTATAPATDSDADAIDGMSAPPPPLFVDLHSARARDALDHIPPEWRRSVLLLGNGTLLRMPLRAADALLCALPSESMRRTVYLAHHAPARVRAQERALGRVVRARARLARALGASSYADLVQPRCVAGGSHHVRAMLNQILDTLQPQSLAERRALQLAKLVHSDDGSGAAGRARAARLAGSSYSSLPPAMQAEVDAVPLHPWDRSFLIRMARAELLTTAGSAEAEAGTGAGDGHGGESKPVQPSDPSEFLSVGNVVRGMQLLLGQVFGIEARLVRPTRQEDWTSDAEARVDDELIKIELWEPTDPAADLRHPSPTVATSSAPPSDLPTVEAASAASAVAPPNARRLLGIIYLDLYARTHKHPRTGTFTLRSARDNMVGQQWEEGDSNETSAGSGASLGRQLPVVGIMASFSRPSARAGVHPHQSRWHGCRGGGRLTLLNYSEAESLFHELGHALHALMSCTRFQLVSGQRGAPDVVELSSTLFELFLTRVDFVAQWARHYLTDEPMRDHMLQGLVGARRAFARTEMAGQAALALFDQHLHGTPGEGEGDEGGWTAAAATSASASDSSAAMYRLWWQLHSRSSPFRLDADAAAARPLPFAHEVHLLSYGATYYSYLYCRLFSSLIWSAHVNVDEGALPLSRTAGAFLRRELFAPGGAADPIDILKRLARVPPQQSLQRFVEEQLPLFLHHRTATAADGTATAAASATSADVDVALPADSGIAQQESLARAHMHAATSRSNTAA